MGNGPAQNWAAKDPTWPAQFAKLSGFNARTPVAGSAAVVGDGENMDYIVGDQVNEMVRKAVYAQTPELKLLANSTDRGA